MFNDSYILSFLGPFVAVLIVLFLLMLLIRELVCWYWKINLINENLDHIDHSTKRMLKDIDDMDTHTHQSLHEIAQILLKLHDTADKQLAILQQMQPTNLQPTSPKPPAEEKSLWSQHLSHLNSLQREKLKGDEDT